MVSLDGYVRAAEGDDMRWVFESVDDELRAWKVDGLWQAGTLIMGRKVYEEMAAHWPTSTEVYAPPMNEIPKVVFSRSLAHSLWNNTRVCNGYLAEEITRLKQENGKDVLAHGGADFARPLSRLGLIDEYRLVVHPVALSGGLTLFKRPVDLKLLTTQSFPGGAVLLTYDHR